MVNKLFEHGVRKHASKTSKRLDVPNNTRSIRACWNSPIIQTVHLNTPDSSPVLLERRLHHLALLVDFPNANFAIHSARYQFLTVRSTCDRSDPVDMGVCDAIKQFAWLRKESADFAVVPAGIDRFPVSHESNAEAFKVRNMDAKHFLSRFGVPDANVVFGAGPENFWVVAELLYLILQKNILFSFILQLINISLLRTYSLVNVDLSIVCFHLISVSANIFLPRKIKNRINHTSGSIHHLFYRSDKYSLFLNSSSQILSSKYSIDRFHWRSKPNRRWALWK